MSDITKANVKLGTAIVSVITIIPLMYWLIAGNITAASAKEATVEIKKEFKEHLAEDKAHKDAQTVILMDIKNEVTAIKTELRLRRNRESR